MDRCHARVAVCGIERRGAAAGLNECTTARDRAAGEIRPLGDGIGTFDAKGAVIADSTAGRERTSGAAIAKLERARADYRRAGLGVGVGENQRAAAIDG